MCTDTCISMHMTCADMCTGMVIDTCTDMSIDMCIDMCTDVCIDMCTDMCVDMCAWYTTSSFSGSSLGSSVSSSST